MWCETAGWDRLTLYDEVADARLAVFRRGAGDPAARRAAKLKRSA